MLLMVSCEIIYKSVYTKINVRDKPGKPPKNNKKLQIWRRYIHRLCGGKELVSVENISHLDKDEIVYSTPYRSTDQT